MTSDNPRQDAAGHTVTIYDTCRQFEAARASGADPRIEDFLQEGGEADRGVLLRELLCMEIAARRQRDEQPSLEEYHSRFPDDGRAVEEAFERASAETLEDDIAPTRIIAPPEGAEPAPSLGDIFSATGQTEILGGGPRGPAPAETGGVSDYDLLEKLGEGGMGVVYRARQRSADRIVAVKVIRPDRIQNLPEAARQAAIDRFRNEAHATARIDHDHIVTVYEVGEYEGRHFFSMRYVPGRSLSQLIADGALSNRQAARYMQQVASAIHAAHLHGILHRDLKPQNVLVDEDAERAMVADFGLAKLIEDESQLTREGEIMGTPQYMSPEQARDAASVTTLTDVYALGATLYHLLTGQPPFPGGTAVEVLRRVIDEQPARPSTIQDDVDPDLETICLKCMEKEPQQRYASALEVAEELGRYLEGRPIQARPLGAAARFRRWCRRNPLVASLAGTALASLVVALVVAGVGYVKATAALDTAT
ncbi:MAG: serine/threonine protein kinase, partial [Planctomycetes bacterium]|nr:serine/threonine protein kinase [Planctomycetota bacterium]